MSDKKSFFGLCSVACIILPFICSSLIAHPLFASPKTDLEKTQKAIEQSRQKQEQLDAQHTQLEGELKSLQDKLVELASAIQKREADLSAAEEKLRLLSTQLTAKNEALQAGRKQLNALVDAALRLSRTPPEAMVMMPGDITQTIKAARALQMASEAIRKQTVSIGLQLAELQRLKDKVTRNRDEIATSQQALDGERKALNIELAQRQAVLEKLGQEQKVLGEKLAQLSKKAADLQDLVSSITHEENEENAAARKKNGSSSAHKGRMHSPVAGEVVQAFGAADGHGGTSKGVTLETRAHAQVTAPSDGEVVFTGPFLNYGKLVIIRHGDDFHTLLAGLSKIDAEVGQFLLEGEPIGAMGEGESGERLYVELRKNNQPVDPAQWISGLKQ